MSVKICKALEIRTPIKLEDGVEEMVEFAPEHPELIDPHSTNIHPDANGEMWYWTPEPELPVEAE